MSRKQRERRKDDYLKAIYEVSRRKGYARVTDVSKLLNVSPSTVTEMFQRLYNEGLINYEKYSGATLTEAGRKVAEALTEKFAILKEFLTILGVDEDTAEKDAHFIEHGVSAKTIDVLTKFVEFMKTREDPRWLERFKTYYRTGKLPECPKKERQE
jgi:DtxR family Mn-dependent transcriptional regulator